MDYINRRQYARGCSIKDYEQRKAYEMKLNPISNELYKKDYNMLRKDQQENVVKQYWNS